MYEIPRCERKTDSLKSTSLFWRAGGIYNGRHIYLPYSTREGVNILTIRNYPERLHLVIFLDELHMVPHVPLDAIVPYAVSPSSKTENCVSWRYAKNNKEDVERFWRDVERVLRRMCVLVPASCGRCGGIQPYITCRTPCIRCQRATRTIQKAWHIASNDPRHSLCRQRLMRMYEEVAS